MKNKAIRLVSLILDQCPWLRKLKDSLMIFTFKVLYKIRRHKQHESIRDRYSITPSLVTKVLTDGILPAESMGKTRDGNWDAGFVELADTDTYKGMVARFIEGKEWQETEYFKRVCRQVESGRVMWGCKNIDQVLNRFSQIDKLFQSMSEHGFIQPEEQQRLMSSQSDLDNIIVCIDRDGRYILHDGMHRLIAAQLLHVDNITVSISLRHKAWHLFCEDVYAYASFHGKLYAPIKHPDLSHVSSNHDHQRFDAMPEFLPDKPGKVLDIGSHWGYFCHCLDELGFQCTALEPDAKNLYFMKKLMKASSCEFEILEKRLFETSEIKKYQLVLALYVFHHFLKREDDYNSLLKFLGELDAETMFFATHSPDEPQMLNAFKNLSPEEFSDLILAHSRFTHKSCIWSEPGGGRRLYLLSK
jgi:2-polyprenyl-3-methyl-5-hydroxy-6-metoxy-1,4-benzoquinol methylase